MRNDTAASPADLVELGRVVGAYGVRGWVKIEPYAVQSEALLRARDWWLRRDANDPPQRFEVVKSRTQGSTIVAQLDKLATREQAAALRGNRVWVSRAAFPSPETDEYYWVDLIGCLVYGLADGVADAATERVLLGRVTEVSDNGAHAVLQLERLSEPDLQPVLDARGRGQEVLVPFVAAHVQSVDLGARVIETDWPSEV